MDTDNSTSPMAGTDSLLKLWQDRIDELVMAKTSEDYEKGIVLLVHTLKHGLVIDGLIALGFEHRSRLISATLVALRPAAVELNRTVLSALLPIAGLSQELRQMVLDYPVQVKSTPGSSAGYVRKTNTRLVVGVGLIAVVIGLYFFKARSSGSELGANRTESGELFNSDVHSKGTRKDDQPFARLNHERVRESEQSWLDSTWDERTYVSGAIPRCFNVTPRYDKAMDNYLRIVVGSGTDVVVKLMNRKTDKCIRYVFVRSGDTYSILNIPEGMYYLKIGYGRRWVEKVESGTCIGRFASNALYEQGEELLDYHITKTGTTQRGDRVFENLSIPSFEIQLDVTETGLMNSFDTEKISEAAFNQ